MAKIINLRSARKRAKREASKAEADVNAAQHGQTKAERTQRAQEKARAKTALDNHLRET
ncbi:MAG: DUF4169 family protein [Pseudomonadota bacterium]